MNATSPRLTDRRVSREARLTLSSSPERESGFVSPFCLLRPFSRAVLYRTLLTRAPPASRALFSEYRSIPAAKTFAIADEDYLDPVEMWALTARLQWIGPKKKSLDLTGGDDVDDTPSSGDDGSS